MMPNNQVFNPMFLQYMPPYNQQMQFPIHPALQQQNFNNSLPLYFYPQQLPHQQIPRAPF